MAAYTSKWRHSSRSGHYEAFAKGNAHLCECQRIRAIPRRGPSRLQTAAAASSSTRQNASSRPSQSLEPHSLQQVRRCTRRLAGRTAKIGRRLTRRWRRALGAREAADSDRTYGRSWPFREVWPRVLIAAPVSDGKNHIPQPPLQPIDEALCALSRSNPARLQVSSVPTAPPSPLIHRFEKPLNELCALECSGEIQAAAARSGAIDVLLQRSIRVGRYRKHRIMAIIA